jgi:RNA polymerase sigma-70 factor (ECF subfamily)
MDDSQIARHLELARGGDRSAVGALFEGYRVRLERMVRLRLDRRLRGRVDEADVVQDTFLEAARRIEDYLERPDMPFFLWLRFLANQRLQALCREHLGARKRDARREIHLADGGYPEASSEALAAQLLGKLTTPSQAAMRAEMKARLTQALESMEPEDREIIALRHFEELRHAEAAHVLGIDEAAASKR